MLGRVNRTIIAALIAAIAIGGSLGAFAATQTIETTASVDVRVWRRISDGQLFISTRPEDSGPDAWVTSDVLDMSGLSQSGRFQLSDTVTVDVPVSVEVDVPEASTGSTRPTRPIPEAVPEDETPIAGPCCEVRGMEDTPQAGRNIVTDMRRVIDFALDEYGLTHIGHITINIAHSRNGMFTRYEEVFGYRPEELPDECSFQEGEHMFFTPACRADRLALAWEWFVRAAGAGEVKPQWAGHGAFDYFASHYATGKVPVITEDRFRRVLFYEQARDIRLDQASDNMMTLVMLYTIHEHGEFADWLRFYSSTQAGLPVGTAFESVFEISLAKFYETFEEWADHQKLVLTSTAFRSCQEASQHIKQVVGSVGFGQGFPDYRVPLEIDDDDDGVVCEGFVAATQDVQ